MKNAVYVDLALNVKNKKTLFKVVLKRYTEETIMDLKSKLLSKKVKFESTKNTFSEF